MIFPVKKDLNRPVRYRRYLVNTLTGEAAGETVTGKLVGIEKMLVAVAFGDERAPLCLNRVDLEWVEA